MICYTLLKLENLTYYSSKKLSINNQKLSNNFKKCHKTNCIQKKKKQPFF